MSTDLATQPKASVIEKVIMHGDLKALSEGERMSYYGAVCESVGLNPLTQPFAYITLNGKLTLYALKSCTDQLRKINHVSVTELTAKESNGLYVVTCQVRDKEGRTDASTGAVFLGSLKGEALANCIMKAETKAKRRATLSICGLSLLDETEAESIPGATTTPVNVKQDIPNGEPQAKPAESPDANTVSVWQSRLNPDVMNCDKLNAELPNIRAITHEATRKRVWTLTLQFAEANGCAWDDGTKRFTPTNLPEGEVPNSDDDDVHGSIPF